MAGWAEFFKPGLTRDAEQERERTPSEQPPEGQVEGVDGEWIEEEGEEGEEEGDGLEDGEEDEMAKMMGFGGFGSTKVRIHHPSLPYPFPSLFRKSRSADHAFLGSVCRASTSLPTLQVRSSSTSPERGGSTCASFPLPYPLLWRGFESFQTDACPGLYTYRLSGTELEDSTGTSRIPFSNNPRTDVPLLSVRVLRPLAKMK